MPPTKSGHKRPNTPAPNKQTDLKKAKLSQGKHRVTKVVPVLESEASDEDDSQYGSEASYRTAGETVDEEIDTTGDGENVKPVKDPQASRESHKIQKELQAQRRAAKPHSALLTEAKRVWALARKIDLPPVERKKHIAELMNILRGNVQDIVFKHDASRIVQTLVKYGGQAERDEVAAELKGKYRDLAQNKYSKFLVTKLIRYCKTHRSAILAEFHSHVIRLLLHREACPIIADAYDLHASAADRNLLLRDFYGKEVALFDSATIKSKGLRGALSNVTPERRKRVLGAVAESLISIFNNPDKGAVAHAIVHRVLWEYLSELALFEETEKDEAERLRRELFDSCQELLAEIVHTKDGSRAAREFIARGSAKDRKQIIKVLKPHVEQMCADEEAQLVLFTLFDLVDDTKLVGKSLVGDISTHSSAFARTMARRVLLYLLIPRSPRHFSPDLLRLISQTDYAQGTTSKKDVDVRRAELRAAASPGMIKAVEEDAEGLLRDRGASMFVGEVMLYADGDRTKALEALLAPISQPYAPLLPTSDPSDPTLDTHVLNLSHASRMYKTLIQGGHFNQQTKTIDRVQGAPKDVAKSFVRGAGRENILAMGLGDEAFLVAEIVGRLVEDGGETEVKAWFGRDEKMRLRMGGRKGSTVLLDRLGA